MHTQTGSVALNGISTPGSSTNIGRTNYVGCAGYLGTTPGTTNNRYKGAFLNRSSLSLGELSAADGTSNTFLFGESCGENPYRLNGSGGVRIGSLSWMGGAIEVLTWGMPDPPEWYHFSSLHTSVIMFAMSDGSVRGVRKGAVYPDPNFWESIYEGGFTDGVVTNPSAISN
jgi:hypothetical protein